MNVVIVGGGQVGSYLASLLIKDSHRVKVVEMRDKQLSNLRRDLPPDAVVAGNFTDPSVLEKAGIKNANVVVALTPTDEANLVISTLAKLEFGVKRVIARANNPKNSWMFTPVMGVDVGLTEADLMAHVVAEEMSLGDMMTLLKLNKGRYSMVQEKVHPASSVVGKTLRELKLPNECNVAAILRKNDIIIPRGDTVLQAGDDLVALSSSSQVQAFAALLAPVR